MSSYPSKSEEMRKDVVDVDLLERSETASDNDVYWIIHTDLAVTDPLNMPIWRKRLLVVLLSICKAQLCISGRY
jgi:hypothetical protein